MQASQVALVVKNLFASAGDGGLIPGSEKEMATHSSILAWKIPWTEELGGLQSIGSQRVGLLKRLSAHDLAHTWKI